VHAVRVGEFLLADAELFAIGTDVRARDALQITFHESNDFGMILEDLQTHE
jgi:hypothetical protein